MSNRLLALQLTAVFGVAAFGAVELVGLSDEAGARKVLDNQGWTPVKHEGHVFFGCGKGDLWRDEFVAKNPAGKEVEVIVCQGIFKGATIRTP